MVLNVQACVKKTGIRVGGTIFYRESLDDVIFGIDESGVESLAENGAVAGAGGGLGDIVDRWSVRG